MANEMQTRADNIHARYLSLKEPCVIRSDNLRESHELYQWLRFVRIIKWKSVSNSIITN